MTLCLVLFLLNSLLGSSHFLHHSRPIDYRSTEQILGLYQNHLLKQSPNDLSDLENILEELLVTNQHQGDEEDAGSDHDSPRHILTIMSDDQGWGDIGYHDPSFLSPVIDSLAHNGIIFNNFYVQCTCTPTRASMITGRYVIRTGLQDGAVIPGESRHLPRDFKTAGEYFKSANYSTYMLGKWHLGQEYLDLLPNARGYDYFYGSIGTLSCTP
jgi:arylsulfatase A-like enzyme